MSDNSLQVVIQQSGVEQSRVQELLSHFGKDFQSARSLVESVKDIKVDSETQIKEMADARKARLQLRSIRLQVENTRKQLKEQSLREGKAIDGAANIIKALIIPVEEHLEKQERFAEEIRLRRQREKLEERKRILMQYVSDVSVYDLVNMGDDTFEKVVHDAKAAKEAQIAEQKKEEERRLEQQRRNDLHYARKNELIPYWTFLGSERWAMNFADMSDESFDALLSEVKAAQKKDAEERVRIAKENEELRKKQEEERRTVAEEQRKKEEELRQANEEKARLERELQAKKDAEEKAKREEQERIEKEKAAAVEAERQRLLAPDRDKLLALAEQIKALEMPKVDNPKAKKVVLEISGMLGRLNQFIKQRAEQL